MKTSFTVSVDYQNYWCWEVRVDGLVFRQGKCWSCWRARMRIRRTLKQLDQIEALGTRA